MGQLALGAVGAGIGSLYGNPMMGFSVGMMVGGILFPAQTNPVPVNRSIQGSDYGAAIPIVFGKWRLAGQLIWAAPLIDGGSRSTGGGSGGQSSETYLLDATIMFCEGPVTLLTVWADSDLVADYTQIPPVFASSVSASHFVFHPGYSDPGTTHTDQLPDSTIVSFNGATATPAYTNRATLTVVGFPWSNYGHTPNFTALVQQSVSPTLSSILTTLFLRVGIDSGDLDFSAVSGITVDGFMVPGRMDLASAIKPLQDAYHFDVVEVDGIIKASPRSTAASFTFDPKWIGVTTDGEPPSNPVEPTRRPETDLPRSVDISFLSAARDYQTGSQTVRRFAVTSQNQDTLNLPLVLSDNAARQSGEAYLYERWNQRRGYRFTYTPDYLFVAPGDVGYLTVNGQQRTVRITEQTMGLFGHIEAVAVEHEPTIYTQILPGDGYGAGSITPGTGTLAGYVLDVNSPTDAHVFLTTGGEMDLLGACLGRPGTSWRGGIWAIGTSAIYGAATGGRLGGGANHLEFPNMSTFGVTSAALASASYDVIDTTSSLTVVMNCGALATCSDDDFISAAKNLALVGTEYIQFRDVVQVSTGVYTVSHLIRGARGTEASISTHSSTEPFILIDNNIKFWETAPSRIGSPANTGDFGGYENGVDAANGITETGQPITGLNLLCYAPCNIAATRDGSSNITLTWNRRARVGGADPWTVALETKDNSGHAYELYIVEIYVGAVLKHAYTITAQQGGTTYLANPTATISAADQIAYCGGLQTPLSVKVYQLNYFLPINGGRGYPASASV